MAQPIVQRAAWGASHVVAAIDPLKDVVPPGVDPTVWRNAIDETHAMLVTVVGSNLLDLDDMNKLRVELDQFVSRARAHPETAPTELAAVWNTLADRAEFLFQDGKDPTRDRHTRPKILPPRPAKTAAAMKVPSTRTILPPLPPGEGRGGLLKNRRPTSGKFPPKTLCQLSRP